MITLVLTVGHSSTKLSLHHAQAAPFWHCSFDSINIEDVLSRISDPLQAALRDSGAQQKIIERILFATTNASIDHNSWSVNLRKALAVTMEVVSTKHIFSNPERYNLPSIAPKDRQPANAGKAQESDVGIDILCNIIASMYYYPQQNIIILDLGTAQTITVLGKDKQIIGVAIAPGGQTVISSMHKRIPHLPNLTFKSDPSMPYLALDTIKAMQCGSYWMVDCYTRNIIKGIQQTYFPRAKARVIFTGGGYYGQSQNHNETRIPTLTNQGLWLLTAKHQSP